jgi:hypothetical protein
MSQQSKQRKLKEGLDEILDFCKQHKLRYRFIMPYQLRVEEQVDFYPTNRKYCYLELSHFGNYSRIEDPMNMIKSTTHIMSENRIIPEVDLSDRDILLKRCHDRASEVKKPERIDMYKNRGKTF